MKEMENRIVENTASGDDRLVLDAHRNEERDKARDPVRDSARDLAVSTHRAQEGRDVRDKARDVARDEIRDQARDTAMDTHLLPIPIPLPYRDSTFVVFTKFLSWLTAVLLATAVIISLVSVTSERDTLRDQLTAQSTELTCRAKANVVVSRASSENQIALDNHAVLLGSYISYVSTGNREDPIFRDGLNIIVSNINSAGVILDAAGRTLRDAVDDQEDALKDCDRD